MKNCQPVFGASNRERGAFEIAFLYLTISSLWILFSDKLAAQIAPDQPTLTMISIYKGWAYVVITALMLYWRIRHDAIKHKRAELEMSILVERLDLATRAAQIGIWDWDISQNKLIWDERMYALYGMKHDEFPMAYEAWLKGVHPDDREPSNKISQQALHGEREYDTEFRVLWPDGSVHWLKATGQVFRNEATEPIRMIGINYDITERKRAESASQNTHAELELQVQLRTAALSQANMLLETMLEYTPDQIYFKDTESRFIRNSRAQATALGLSDPSQAAGKTDFDFFPHAQRSYDEEQEIIRSGKPLVDFEERVAWPDGKETWVSTTKVPLRDPNGQVIGTFGISRDITEHKRVEESLRKAKEELELKVAERTNELKDTNAQLQLELTERQQAEEKLRESEALFRQAIEAAGAVPYSHNYETNIYTFMGEGILALTGYPVEEITPTLFGSLEKQTQMMGEASHLHSTEAGKLMRAGQLKKWRCDSLVVTRDGTPRWVADASVATFDGTGKAIGSIGILQDITERKRAEEALRKSEERLNGIIVSAMDAIISVDTEQVVVLFNAAAEKMFGCLASETVGKPLERFISERFRAVHREHIRVFGETRVTNRAMNALGVILGQRTNGEEFPIEASISQIELDGKKLYTVILRDITERKRAEEELKRSNAELEQFAYVASHDLQEPLRAVAGMVQLLQQRYQGKLDERADEYIGHAVDASTRMQNLINDLLEYSRVNRFGKPLATSDLESCLKNALANLQVSIQESNVQITHAPLPTITADATQMTQVLQNLIGNAIKFRGERALHIHIDAKQLEQAWQFEVRDNGIGIQSQHFERIFQVFQRLHTRREYPGTGIGLSLCKKIIERHGGQIWLESQPGEGSVFFFTLPERES